MKRSTKFLAAIILVFTLMMSILPLTAIAADEGTVIYLVPNENWKKDNARFAMYVWTSTSDYKWIDMTDDDGDGIYEGVLPAGYTNIIFGRMTYKDSHNGWSTTWNQTNNLVYDGTKNMYTVAEGAWSYGDGKWSVYDANACAHSYGTDNICTKCGKELFYIVAGYVFKDGDTYVDGDNTTLFGSKWDVTDENNKMEYDPESGCYIKIYENVAKGEYEFKIAVNKSWDESYGDSNNTKNGNFHLVVEKSGSTVLITLKDGKVTFACSVPLVPENKPETTPDNTPDTTPDNEANTENTENTENTQNPGSTNQPTEKPGASTDDTNEPEVKLNFFQRIWLAIVNFFARIFGKKA